MLLWHRTLHLRMVDPRYLEVISYCGNYPCAQPLWVDLTLKGLVQCAWQPGQGGLATLFP